MKKKLVIILGICLIAVNILSSNYAGKQNISLRNFLAMTNAVGEEVKAPEYNCPNGSTECLKVVTSETSWDTWHKP